MLNMRIFFAGVIAGVVMGVVEMLFEAFGGVGLWTPLVLIAATLLRDLQGLTPQAPFLPVAVVLGMMGRVLNSALLGFVFAGLSAPRLQTWPGLIGGGILFALIVFVAMWLVVLPL